MGVYVKGLYMPNNCCECALFKSTISGYHFCKGKGVAFGKEDAEWLPKTTPNWCPLVEVKTPHGRLIDADKYEFSGDLIDEPTVIEKEGKYADDRT